MHPLHSIPPLNTLPAEAASLLEARLQPAFFKKGEMIVREGQTQKKLYIITEGILMSYILHGDKQHVVAFVYAPGLAAAPESFFAQQPAAGFLECLTDISGYSFSYDHLQELYDHSRDIERLFRKITEQILAGLILRYNELQTLTIEERFRSFAKRSPHLLQMVPHKHIASYLHINPTNFSKLYNSIRL
jgi:CRP-like cAMP-binding protein